MYYNTNGRVGNNDYHGVYILMEKIKRDPNRVDIEKLNPSDNAEPEITGGYILKKDRLEPGDFGFETTSRQRLAYYEPKEDDITPQQADWIRSYMNQFEAALTSEDTDVYCTLDGTDPRLPGGLVNPEAIKAVPTEGVITLIASDVPASAFIPADDSMGTDWTSVGFDAAAWTQGTTGIGYERVTGYENLIGLDVQDQMWNVNSSAYIRVPFNVADPAELGSLVLRMKYDDGFVACLNGVEVASANSPDTPSWDSSATLQHPDSAAVQFEEFEIDEFLPLLQAGENVLAIHGLNAGSTGADFLILPELSTNDVPSSIITLNESARVTARAVRRADWSGITEATFLVGDPPTLRVSEIMYHPQNPPAGSPYSDDDFEFIELQNSGAETLALGGMSFGDGIGFVFPEMDLAPGGVVVIVANQEAFDSRYGVVDNVIGQYTGQLYNSGDHLLLSGAFAETILDFSYLDTWYPETDGDGHSLSIVNVQADPATWGLEASWKASDQIGGTPGTADTVSTPGDTDGDVDIDDLNNVRNNFGGSGLGDTNGDGIVDINDLNSVRNNFGNTAGPAQAGVQQQTAADVAPADLRVHRGQRRFSNLFTRNSRGHTLAANRVWDTALVELFSDGDGVKTFRYAR